MPQISIVQQVAHLSVAVCWGSTGKTWDSDGGTYACGSRCLRAEAGGFFKSRDLRSVLKTLDL